MSARSGSRCINGENFSLLYDYYNNFGMDNIIIYETIQNHDISILDVIYCANWVNTVLDTQAKTVRV